LFGLFLGTFTVLCGSSFRFAAGNGRGHTQRNVNRSGKIALPLLESAALF
jgi:hypothetical protein